MDLFLELELFIRELLLEVGTGGGGSAPSILGFEERRPLDLFEEEIGDGPSLPVSSLSFPGFEERRELLLFEEGKGGGPSASLPVIRELLLEVGTGGGGSAPSILGFEERRPLDLLFEEETGDGPSLSGSSLSGFEERRELLLVGSGGSAGIVGSPSG